MTGQLQTVITLRQCLDERPSVLAFCFVWYGSYSLLHVQDEGLENAGATCAAVKRTLFMLGFFDRCR